MLKWIIGLVICSPLIFGVALLVASEYGGEKVELETLDERGTSLFTTLWVVELHEEPWLRAGDPEATWLKRLRTEPRVFLIRDGERSEYVAEVSDEGASRVNEAMREKFFKNMSQRAAEMLREDLESKGPVRLSEVEREQKEILKIARRLADEGQIQLGGKGEDEYV